MLPGARRAIKPASSPTALRDGSSSTLTSTAVPGVQRYYDRGDALLQDVVDARVWLGIHFRTADTAAKKMGKQLAAWTLDHYFQPIHEDS
jgi:hypothetical protein